MKAKAFVHINNSGVILNNESLFPELNIGKDSMPFNAIYKQLDISYPKFHKMDNLSKLGFLGVEILKMKIDLKQYGVDRVSQIFQNSYSSLDTDIIHQESINANKMASPAVFVYTFNEHFMCLLCYIPNIILYIFVT